MSPPALLRRGSRWALVLTCVLASGCITVHEGALAQPPPPEEPLPADVSMFYNDLLPYGQWVVVADYGWVWHPYGVYAGWAPYTYGHWVYTTDGWTWLSYWSWGWAPFHYGRWFVDGRYGWCWVPGQVWGPSWVLWRYGGGYVGWAPLPPSVAWVPGGIYITGATVPFVYPGAWVYVQTPYFTATHPRRHFVSPAYRYEVERRTRVETRYEMEGRRVVGRGVPVDDVARATGRPVERHVVVETPTRGRPAVEGNEVRIYRPPQRGQPAGTQPERYQGGEARPAPRAAPPPSQPSGREAQPQGRPASPSSRPTEGERGGKARPAEPQGLYAPEARPAEPTRPSYVPERPPSAPEEPTYAPERRPSEPTRPASEPRPAPPPERHEQPQARPAQPAPRPEVRAPAPPPQRSSEKARSDGKSKESKGSSKSSKEGKRSDGHHEGRPAGH